jgi:hypothetical protein
LELCGLAALFLAIMPGGSALVPRTSKAERQARALCVELARVTGDRPMQYRMVRPIVIAAGLDDPAADAAIAHAVEKGWLTTDVSEDESGPTPSICLTDDGRALQIVSKHTRN